MPRWNEWFTPRRSGNGGNCVETLITRSSVYVRNSKRPADATIEFTHDEWRAFVASVQHYDDYTLPDQDTPGTQRGSLPGTARLPEGQRAGQ
ncbi:MAG TPA: DUF397 domain-containing protein [Pseudonocardia sp.]|jgi:hypothetical protein